ncbi:MAG: hypothetical protein VZR09_00580 [Candidatus Gastranaerophilaceae bacterium]|nr:hypothetical protein [Candidatus Gastranaerophilaceae bacterium]
MKIVKKKGARKQILSTRNGRPTEEIHVPLKRWQRIFERLFSSKKEISYIDSGNPKDFNRFCD